MNQDIAKDPTWWFSRPQTLLMVENKFREFYKRKRRINVTYSAHCCRNKGAGIVVEVEGKKSINYFVETDYRQGGIELLKQSIQFDFAYLNLGEKFSNIRFFGCDFIKDSVLVRETWSTDINLPVIKENIYDTKKGAFDVDNFEAWYHEKKETLYRSAHAIIDEYKLKIIELFPEYKRYLTKDIDNIDGEIKVKMARDFQQTLRCYHTLLSCYSKNGCQANKLDGYIPKELVHKITEYLYDPLTLGNSLLWFKQQYPMIDLSNINPVIVLEDITDEPEDSSMDIDPDNIRKTFAPFNWGC